MLFGSYYRIYEVSYKVRVVGRRQPWKAFDHVLTEWYITPVSGELLFGKHNAPKTSDNLFLPLTALIAIMIRPAQRR